MPLILATEHIVCLFVGQLRIFGWLVPIVDWYWFFFLVKILAVGLDSVQLNLIQFNLSIIALQLWIPVIYFFLSNRFFLNLNDHWNQVPVFSKNENWILSSTMKQWKMVNLTRKICFESLKSLSILIGNWFNFLFLNYIRCI